MLSPLAAIQQQGAPPPVTGQAAVNGAIARSGLSPQQFSSWLQQQGGMPLSPQQLAGAPGGAPGMAKGGQVDGDMPAKKSGRKFGAKEQAAEDIPEVTKKAKGGVLKRRPPKAKVAAKKAPVPTPSPYDYEDNGSATPPVAAGPPPPPAVPMAPPSGPAMAKGGKFIQKAIKHPGALHEDLGVPEDKTIPKKKLAKAAKKSGKVGERARFAEKLAGFKKNKGGACDKMAAGGVAKVRRGFPNTNKAPKAKKFAEGGRIRGCGIAQKGCRFSGVY